MLQLYPPYVYDDHWGAQPCVRLSSVVEEQHFRPCVVEGTGQRLGFRIFSVSIWRSDISIVPLGKRVIRIMPFYPKRFLQRFFQLTEHSWISYSLGISYCSISSIVAWIHVQNDGPNFIVRADIRQEISSQLSYWCKYQWR
jgi:hypothetical protein